MIIQVNILQNLSTKQSFRKNCKKFLIDEKKTNKKNNGLCSYI